MVFQRVHWTNTTKHDLGGYVLVHLSEHGFLLNELAVKPGHDAAIPALLTTVAAAYPTNRQVGGRVFLPVEPTIDQALQTIFTHIEQVDGDTLMVRPVETTIDFAALNELSMASGAIFWPMD